MLLMIVINTLPLLLLAIAWWQYRKEGSSLVGWRKKLFILAVIANAVSSAVLLSFIIHGRVVIANATKGVDLDRAYPVLSMFGVGLVSVILAGFGRRVSRLLLMGDGLLVCLLWYFAALAASP
jgi:hypothetical protein